MPPPHTRAALPVIKLDDSDDDAEINATTSSPNNDAPPLFVLTTEQSHTTSFPVGCPVLYGFAADPSAVHAREGIVKEVAMRVDRRLEYRIEPRGEIERRMRDGDNGVAPALDLAMEDQIAYAIRCDVLVAGEDDAGEGEGEPAEVLSVKTVRENGRESMRYTVQYATAKENYTLRMSEGLTAERLSFNRHYDYAANNEVGESGGDGGEGEIPEGGEEQSDHPPLAVVPLSNSESWSSNANSETGKCMGEPSKGQRRTVEDLPPTMGGGEPLRSGTVKNVHNSQDQSSPRSNDAWARHRAKDLSKVEETEGNADASCRQPMLPSVARTEGCAGDTSTLTCELSDHSGGMLSPDRYNGSGRCAPAARARGTGDTVSPAIIPVQHRKINFEPPVRKRSAVAMTSANTMDLPASSALETMPKKQKLPGIETTTEDDASGPTEEMTSKVQIPEGVGLGFSKLSELEASAGGNVKIWIGRRPRMSNEPHYILLAGRRANVNKAETLVRELFDNVVASRGKLKNVKCSGGKAGPGAAEAGPGAAEAGSKQENTPIIPDNVSMPPSIPAAAVCTVCNEIRLLDPSLRQKVIEDFNGQMSSSKRIQNPTAFFIGMIRKRVDAQAWDLAKASALDSVAAHAAENSTAPLPDRALPEYPQEGFLCTLTVPLWLDYSKVDLFHHILGERNKSCRKNQSKETTSRLGHKTKKIYTETGCSVHLSRCNPKNGVPLLITIDSRGLRVRSKMMEALAMVEESIFDFHQEHDANGRLQFEIRAEADGNFLPPPEKSGAVRMDQNSWVQLLELSRAKTGGIVVLNDKMQLRNDFQARIFEETECSVKVFAGSPDAPLQLCKPYILICGRKLGQVDEATAMITNT